MYSDVELSLRYLVKREMLLTEQYVEYALHCVENICVGMWLYMEGSWEDWLPCGAWRQR